MESSPLVYVEPGLVRAAARIVATSNLHLRDSLKGIASTQRCLLEAQEKLARSRAVILRTDVLIGEMRRNLYF